MVPPKPFFACLPHHKRMGYSKDPNKNYDIVAVKLIKKIEAGKGTLDKEHAGKYVNTKQSQILFLDRRERGAWQNMRART